MFDSHCIRTILAVLLIAIGDASWSQGYEGSLQEARGDRPALVYALTDNSREGGPETFFVDSNGRVLLRTASYDGWKYRLSGAGFYFIVEKNRSHYLVTPQGATLIDLELTTNAEWLALRNERWFCGTADGQVWRYGDKGWDFMGEGFSVFDFRASGGLAPPASQFVRRKTGTGFVYVDDEMRGIANSRGYYLLTSMIDGLGFGFDGGAVYSMDIGGNATAVGRGRWSGYSFPYRGKQCIISDPDGRYAIAEEGKVTSLPECRCLFRAVTDDVLVGSTEGGEVAFDRRRGKWLMDGDASSLGVFSDGRIPFAKVDGTSGLLLRDGNTMRLSGTGADVSLDPDPYDVLVFGVGRLSVRTKTGSSEYLVDREGRVLFRPPAHKKGE